MVNTSDVRVASHFSWTGAESTMVGDRALSTISTLAKQARILALVLDAGGVWSAVGVGNTASNTVSVVADLRGAAIVIRATNWSA